MVSTRVPRVVNNNTVGTGEDEKLKEKEERALDDAYREWIVIWTRGVNEGNTDR